MGGFFNEAEVFFGKALLRGLGERGAECRAADNKSPFFAAAEGRGKEIRAEGADNENYQRYEYRYPFLQ
jgi:hypothetical protein